ncbi:AraC family transcriptional regulator [Paenibacillus sp. 32O-W]|jgi:AraC family transcriptional regulator|nr:AraC family transcriptional regulator [Paenibacillus sp. 32O-W]
MVYADERRSRLHGEENGGELDYRIEEKEAFTVVGKAMHCTCQDNEHTRQIPKFWEDSHRDGTIARLNAVSADGVLLGVMTDMQPGKEEFTYMIASRTDQASVADGLDARTIPASTWAIFTAVGPIPETIQSLFGRIYQEWFPATGYEHAGTPEMEVYPPGDVAAEDYRCEVWIPIVKR